MPLKVDRKLQGATDPIRVVVIISFPICGKVSNVDVPPAVQALIGLARVAATPGYAKPMSTCWAG
jgi:hypothetical protein